MIEIGPNLAYAIVIVAALALLPICIYIIGRHG